MKTSASQIRQLATAWIARRDAGLSPCDEAELAAWLAADPRHRAAFGEYASAWSALDRPARGGAADDVLLALGGLERRRRRRRVLAGSLAAVALLAGVSFWGLHRDGRAPGEAAIAATTRVLWPERRTLADGSVVELKDGAQIAVSLQPAQRRVALLRGEAHFQVAKDPARPFVVEAQGVEVRAVGTAFAVQLGSAAVDVVVTEGHVAIETPLAGGAARTRPAQAILSPGQQALVEPGAVAAKVRALAPTELSERLAWRAPRLEFSGTPLADAVALLNRHAAVRGGVTFSVGDASLAGVRVSGLFRADNTAALLELLENGFGITGERAGGREIVLRKAAPVP